jgi:predicted  nucleic acid-binding Zn-ribbon protein
MRELQDRFQNERSQLEMEIRKLKEALSAKNREGEDFNARINEMSQKLIQASNLEKRAYEYENKVVYATQEIERLNRVLRDRNG